VRTLLVILFAVGVVLAFDRGEASAEPPFVGRCGLATAFVAPSASTAGSITIGSLTVKLTANDRVPSQVAGTVVCTRPGTLTSGPILVVQPIAVPLCGSVETLYSPDGSITLMILKILDNDPSYRVALQVRGVLPAFIAESTARGVSGCFEFALDAAGDVVITRFIGGGSAPPPTLPHLPSTSTAD
jgi:hypothetical protein